MTPEEALRHAYAADIARLPQHLRGEYDANSMAANHAKGTADPRLARFRELVSTGHPNYVPKDDDDRELQDQMLSGYSGQPFTPSQQQALGRDPEPYEYSPGGKYQADIEARARLYDDLSAKPAAATPSRGMTGSHGFVPNFATAGTAWTHTSSQRKDEDAATSRKQIAADSYMKSRDRTHSVDKLVPFLPRSMQLGYPVAPYDPTTGYAQGFDAPNMQRILDVMQNPENSLGALSTQVTGAVSDGMSLLGTALLRENPGKNVSNVLGDAATRVAGADFYRSNPAITTDGGWRANNALIQEGKDARSGSEGMNSQDTFRAAIGNHLPFLDKSNGQVPVFQPFINAGLGIVNGLLDGTGSVGSLKSVASAVQGVAKGVARAPIPVVKGFANSTANTIAAHLKANPTYAGRFVGYNVDEAADLSNLAEGGFELGFSEYDKKNTAEFNAAQKTEEQERVNSIKKLESLNSQVVRPKTVVSRIGGAIAPVGKLLGGLLSP